METQNIASDVSKTIRTKRSNKRFVDLPTAKQNYIV